MLVNIKVNQCGAVLEPKCSTQTQNIRSFASPDLLNGSQFTAIVTRKQKYMENMYIFFLKVICFLQIVCKFECMFFKEQI